MEKIKNLKKEEKGKFNECFVKAAKDTEINYNSFEVNFLNEDEKNLNETNYEETDVKIIFHKGKIYKLTKIKGDESFSLLNNNKAIDYKFSVEYDDRLDGRIEVCLKDLHILNNNNNQNNSLKSLRKVKKEPDFQISSENNKILIFFVVFENLFIFELKDEKFELSILLLFSHKNISINNQLIKKLNLLNVSYYNHDNIYLITLQNKNNLIYFTFNLKTNDGNFLETETIQSKKNSVINTIFPIHKSILLIFNNKQVFIWKNKKLSSASLKIESILTGPNFIVKLNEEESLIGNYEIKDKNFFFYVFSLKLSSNGQLNVRLITKIQFFDYFNEFKIICENFGFRIYDTTNKKIYFITIEEDGKKINVFNIKINFVPKNLIGVEFNKKIEKLYLNGQVYSLEINNDKINENEEEFVNNKNNEENTLFIAKEVEFNNENHDFGTSNINKQSEATISIYENRLMNYVRDVMMNLEIKRNELNILRKKNEEKLQRIERILQIKNNVVKKEIIENENLIIFDANEDNEIIDKEEENVKYEQQSSIFDPVKAQKEFEEFTMTTIQQTDFNSTINAFLTEDTMNKIDNNNI